MPRLTTNRADETGNPNFEDDMPEQNDQIKPFLPSTNYMDRGALGGGASQAGMLRAPTTPNNSYANLMGAIGGGQPPAPYGRPFVSMNDSGGGNPAPMMQQPPVLPQQGSLPFNPIAGFKPITVDTTARAPIPPTNLSGFGAIGNLLKKKQLGQL